MDRPIGWAKPQRPARLHLQIFMLPFTKCWESIRALAFSILRVGQPRCWMILARLMNFFSPSYAVGTRKTVFFQGKSQISLKLSGLQILFTGSVSRRLILIVERLRNGINRAFSPLFIWEWVSGAVPQAGMEPRRWR